MELFADADNKGDNKKGGAKKGGDKLKPEKPSTAKSRPGEKKVETSSPPLFPPLL